MSAHAGFHAEVRQLLRDRVLQAARELVVEQGWAAVTMSAIAQRVGVSRQSLYKTMGAKQALGEALVAREADAFLAGVTEQLRGHADDPVAGMNAAVEFTLREGANNALLKAIAAPGPDHDLGLLPLLTTSGNVLARITDVVAAALVELHGQRLSDPHGLRVAVENVVRLTLSHLLQPLTPPTDAAVQLRPVVAQLLQLARAGTVGRGS